MLTIKGISKYNSRYCHKYNNNNRQVKLPEERKKSTKEVKVKIAEGDMSNKVKAEKRIITQIAGADLIEEIKIETGRGIATLHNKSANHTSNLMTIHKEELISIVLPLKIQKEILVLLNSPPKDIKLMIENAIDHLHRES